MSHDPLARVAALAPEHTVDQDGLVLARAALERRLATDARAGDGLATDGRTAARALRRPVRRRYLRRLALAAACAVALTAGVIVLPARLGGSGPGAAGDPHAPDGPLTTGILPAAAAADGHCTTRTVHDGSDPVKIPRARWSSSPIGSVATLVGDARPEGVWAYESPRDCPAAVAVAVVYDAKRLRGVNVYRDVARNDETEIESYAEAVPVDVRGVTGHVFAWHDEEGDRQRLTWTDADGVRWYAVSDGMPTAKTLAVLDALSFGKDGRLRRSSVPAGFRAAPEGDAQAGTEPTYTWSVQYGGSDQVHRGDAIVDQQTADYVYLEVSSPALEPIEARVAAFRDDALVDLDGVTASWAKEGQGGEQLTWVEHGAVYRLTANVSSLDALLAVARTVHAVDPQDPLVQGTDPDAREGVGS